MDKFTSAELGTGDGKKCSKCGMHKEDNGGCCRDDIKVVKLQQDTQLSKYITVSFTLALVILAPSAHIAAPFYNFIFIAADFSRPPPLLSKQDTYLSNRVFRL